MVYCTIADYEIYFKNRKDIEVTIIGNSVNNSNANLYSDLLNKEHEAKELQIECNRLTEAFTALSREMGIVKDMHSTQDTKLQAIKAICEEAGIIGPTQRIYKIITGATGKEPIPLDTLFINQEKVLVESLKKLEAIKLICHENNRELSTQKIISINKLLQFIP